MNIDFVEPKLPSRRAWIFASLPMVLAVLLWGVSLFLDARLDARRAQLVAAELGAKAPAAASTVPRPAPAYQADAQIAVRRAELPEADALAEIEHVEVAGIQLRFIDVDPARNMVMVELDAASDDALGDYLDQFNAGEPVPKWHIVKLAAPTKGARTDGVVNLVSPVAPGHSVSIARPLATALP